MNERVNEFVKELTPYAPGKPVEEVKREYNLDRVVKLASNENPLPIPGNVSDAITRELAQLNLYPDSDSYYTRERIAQYNGIPMENVIIGAGSVELIRMVIMAFLKPGETVLTSEKSFVFYKIATIESAGKKAFIEAPMTGDYKFDTDGMLRLMDEHTRVIFIANPNNPTGTMLSRDQVYRFIEKVPEDKFIVLDNAYQEYVADPERYPDGMDLALEKKNVILLRTFSKIYGLAGLRIGYGVAHSETISYLGRVKAPFNVSRVAQEAVIASLENDEFKNKSMTLNTENREKLYRHIKNLGIEVVPSETNFLLFFPGTDIDELNDRLLREGVIIRPMKGFGVPDAMRVSVGLEKDNDFFIEKLKKCLEEMK